MATDQSFIDFLVDQMKEAGAITFRKMFGEYAIYCGGKVVALVCDNWLYVKPTEGGKAHIGADLVEAPPYPGATKYFLIEDKCDDREWISDLIRITAKELPFRDSKPKPKQRKISKKTKSKKAG